MKNVAIEYAVTEEGGVMEFLPISETMAHVGARVAADLSRKTFTVHRRTTTTDVAVERIATTVPVRTLVNSYRRVMCADAPPDSPDGKSYGYDQSPRWGVGHSRHVTIGDYADWIAEWHRAPYIIQQVRVYSDGSREFSTLSTHVPKLVVKNDLASIIARVKSRTNTATQKDNVRLVVLAEKALAFMDGSHEHYTELRREIERS